MASIDKQTLLATHYLFRDLETEVIERIAALGVTRELNANQVLFLKGDPGDAMYVVLSGKIRISASAQSGKEIVLAVMERCEVFGEIALLDGKPRTADALAMEPTKLFMIRRRDFLDFLEQEPRFTIHLLELVCGRLRQSNNMIEDTAFMALPARLAKQLLSMVECHGEPGSPSDRVEISISQNDLGQLMGTSRESVNKYLQGWKKKGWIALGRNRVMIRDCDALQKLIDTGLDG